MRFSWKENIGVSDDIVSEKVAILLPYLERLRKVATDTRYSSHESSLFLPSDSTLIKKVAKVANTKKKGDIKYIFVVGIGGSHLGTRALYEAKFLFSDLFTKRIPRIYFIDTINTAYLESLMSFVKSHVEDPSEFVLVTATKSGTTTETVVNTEVFMEALRGQFTQKEVYSRSVFITEEGSPLWKEGEKNNVDLLLIPKTVGGRYSVFSAVGLLPLALSGIDIESLVKKVAGARDTCLLSDKEKNPALISAAFIHHHLCTGKSIHNTFLFNSELEGVGKWYRQLVGESLGKKHNKNNEEVHTGITPIVSVGSTDLHSVAQLYFGGPQDKMTTFVRARSRKKLSLPKKGKLSLVKGASGKTTEEVMDAIYEGAKRAYAKAGMPFLEVELSQFGDVAAFLQFKMIETMLVGYLLNVDAFDQPQVELYKEETRNLLEN